MTRPAWCVRAMTLVALLAAAGTGAAQGRPGDEARRTQLFQAAKQHADEGRWADAVGPLREVIAIRSAPKALIALAVVERELVHYLEARRLLVRALADAQAQGLDDDAEAAKTTLAALEPLIPTVVIDGADAEPALVAFVDDQPAERVGDVLFVDPGTHVIRLEAPGRPPQRETVEAVARQAVHVKLAAAPAAGPPEPRPAAPADSGPQLVGPLLLGGLGVASAGVGLAVLLLGREDQAEAEETCGGTESCPRSVQPLVESGRDKIIAGDVLLGVGGAIAIGGAIWLVVELTGSAGEPAPVTAAGQGIAVRF